MPHFRVAFYSALLASCLMVFATPLRAQHGGGGHGGAGMGLPGFTPGGGYGPDYGRGLPNRNPDSAGSMGGLHTRPQLGPMGRWWNDKHFAKTLKLSSDQQQRMDMIFEASRPALAKGLEGLQQEQSRLDAMYRSKVLDENTLYAQIDRVSQARAELGKVYAHFQLQLRGEMASDQLSRLDETTKQP